MGCTCFTSVIVTNATQPVQLYWNPTKDQEQWQKYSNLENEIIEDAYNEKMTIEVEIDRHYTINLEHLVQYKKKDLQEQFRIKCVQLDGSRTNVHLREARFTNPILIAPPGASPIPEHEPLSKQYWRVEIENKNKTMEDLAEDAARGIIKEGTALCRLHEAQWLAKQLLKVKHFGDDVETQFSRVPKEIGETCVYLYTEESFWYKSIYDFLRKPEIMANEQLKTYASFCHLMHWYLKKQGTTDNVKIIYRSLNLNEKKRLEFMKPTIKLTSFTSFTKRLETAKQYDNTLLVIHLDGEDQLNTAQEDLTCGADIFALSDFSDEEEFLI